MISIDNLLDRLFEKKVIVNCDRDPYLIRWYVIRTERFAIFIHKFIRSDEDRALHDHPWNFIVIPIWRGYIEHSESDLVDPASVGYVPSRTRALQQKRRVWPIIGTRKRPATYRHRVELLRVWEQWEGLTTPPYWSRVDAELPSWSIFIRFREWRQWGFWPKEGWIAWNKWWQNHCE